MHIVFFTHPKFLNQQSMQRYANMLAKGMQERGHTVELLYPKAKFFSVPVPSKLKKWLGYIDQFVIFPIEVKNRLKRENSDTLYVFTDHALGPWVPLVKNKPHVIHCHDFLAQKSALGQITHNPTGFTGKLYQKLIRNGYLQGENFISISAKTRNDLHFLLKFIPSFSELVYNGLNQNFSPANAKEARLEVGKAFNVDLTRGYILHIGGNQWYKNRKGVILIYEAWRRISQLKLPLVMIGQQADKDLLESYSRSFYKQDIHLLTGVGDELIKQSYCGATVFLFPSIDEGFGWPIAEAMASGCPVITTNEAPMTEVSGDAAFLVPVLPISTVAISCWAEEAAKVLEKVIQLGEADRIKAIRSGLENIKRFSPTVMLSKIEKLYLRILEDKTITSSEKEKQY
jgi:glycosyltransferase involved in cell wall biosynthesis